MLKTFSISLFALCFIIANSANAYRLSAPPVKGSPEYQKDFDELFQVQKTRTNHDCDDAEFYAGGSLRSIFGPQTGILTQEEYNLVLDLPRVFASGWGIGKVSALEAIDSEASRAVSIYKSAFHRPRPYEADRKIDPCIGRPGSMNSYPSAHATDAAVLAETLARIFPDKKDAILAQGKKAGYYRVVGGVHHPSDVIAGQSLAHQVVDEFVKVFPDALNYKKIYKQIEQNKQKNKGKIKRPIASPGDQNGPNLNSKKGPGSEEEFQSEFDLSHE